MAAPKGNITHEKKNFGCEIRNLCILNPYPVLCRHEEAWTQVGRFFFEKNSK